MNRKLFRCSFLIGVCLIVLLFVQLWLNGASAASLPRSLPQPNDFLPPAHSLAINSGPAGWQNARLYGGNITKAVYDTQRDAIYLAISGAYYKSTDGGQSWMRIVDQGETAVAVSQVNGKVYLGVSESVWVSSDGGATWVVHPDPQGNVYDITVDPQDGDVVFVGTGKGGLPNSPKDGNVFRSLDGGLTWAGTAVDPGHCISSLAINPNNSQHIWAVSGPCGTFPDHATVFQSTDRGMSFAPVLTSTYGYEYLQAAFDPNGVLYVVGKGVRVSQDGGITFSSPVFTDTIYRDFFPLVINPVSGRAHLFTSDGSYHSDGGYGWVQDDLPPLYAIDPENPLNMLAPYPFGGVMRSTNGGLNWQQANQGIEQVITFALWGSPNDPFRIYAGTGFGPRSSLDGGNTWEEPTLGFAIKSLAVDPTNAAIVYAGGYSSDSRLYISQNSGASWTSTVRITDTNAQIATLAMHPNQPAQLYAGLATHFTDPGGDTTWDGIYASSDSGQHWEQFGLPGEQVSSIVAITATGTMTLYASVGDHSNETSTGGVYRLGAGDPDWTLIGLGDAIVNVVAVDPRDSQHLYAGVGMHSSLTMPRGLYESWNGGNDWTKVTSLPVDSLVWQVYFDPVDPEIIYVAGGGQNDLYRSLDGGQTWWLYERFNQFGLYAAYISPQSNPRLLVALHYGIFYKDLGRLQTISSTVGATLAFTSAQDAVISVAVPAQAVTQTTQFYLNELPEVSAGPAGHDHVVGAFMLDAFQNGVKIDGFSFAQPVTVTVSYSDTPGMVESSLTLMTWNGSAWVDAASTCSPTSTYIRHPEENWFSLPICHLSRFASFAKLQFSLYLPVVMRR